MAKRGDVITSAHVDGYDVIHIPPSGAVAAAALNAPETINSRPTLNRIAIKTLNRIAAETLNGLGALNGSGDRQWDWRPLRGGTTIEGFECSARRPFEGIGS